MSRKRNHRMRPQLANNCYLENVLANSTPPPADDVMVLMNGLRVVYEKLKCGAGTRDDLVTLGMMLNTGCVRGEDVGRPLVEAFEAAGVALVDCENRKDSHGHYGFTGPGILAMNAALDLYGELVAMSSRTQMKDAELEALRLLREQARTAA